uniref:Uncharacterized protein n=1 Tax=Anopheles minimus TaxID=112268 RepID=A0A182WPE5_9DIPT
MGVDLAKTKRASPLLFDIPHMLSRIAYASTILRM